MSRIDPVGCADSGLPDDIALYNDELNLAREKGQSKWFAASWLYAECYLYAFLPLVCFPPQEGN